MDKKGSRVNRVRADRQKKRKFRGNQTTAETDSIFKSTSAKKLRNIQDQVPRDRDSSYVIFNFFTVFTALSAFMECKECHEEVKFGQKKLTGLSFKIQLECACGVKFMDSSPKIGRASEINRRFAFVSRLLPLTRAGMNLFCGLMDISKGFTKRLYTICLEDIHIASKTVFESVLEKAVQEEKQENIARGQVDTVLTVLGDGTWKKRGFSSRYGITTLIGCYSKKVIDVEVKSSFCLGCKTWENRRDTPEFEDWIETHAEKCEKNHSGSAGKMEPDSVVKMFERSEEKYGVRYGTYVGDGDSKTYTAIKNVKPYGDGLLVQKKECVGHVEKRMGTRLRNAKSANKGIGGNGAGKLTNKAIISLTKYYGLAIRRHPNSVEDMRKAVWATFYHRSSTDAEPQHQYCPEGPSSWCKYKKAEAQGELESFKHDKPFNVQIFTVIRPIYEDLTREDLLERCLGAYTQNSNESFNSTLWNVVPKHRHCGLSSLEIATYIACCHCNEGFTTILQIMCYMGLRIGDEAHDFAATRDNERIDRADRRSSFEVQASRNHEREASSLQYDFHLEEEGAQYGAGIAD